MGLRDWLEPLKERYAVRTGRGGRYYLRRGEVAELKDERHAAIDYFTRAIDSGELTDDELFEARRARAMQHELTGRDDLAREDRDTATRIRRGGAADDEQHAPPVDHEAEVAKYTEDLERNPDDHYSLQWRAMSLQRLGRNDEVWADLKRVSELDPDPGSSLSIIRATVMDDLSDSYTLEELNASIEENPEDGWNYATRAYHHDKRGALHEAIRDYTTAVHLLVEEAQTQFQQGMELMDLGAEEEGLGEHEECLELMAQTIGLVERTEKLRGRLSSPFAHPQPDDPADRP